eukprot:CAMPEP_0206051498 /NCGR_PEP_ID=MMETSP1466-20131121/31594_1 /ASSEMBLY_ACC=CAM_ASM_001126 /TAXON_ID=44452 /ORGANISM="Pavlova gyrans, Strain CCMP608" /LENGTH=38 /DNA_ID= /DNA_START= /DNA_END= /DNA_ORIENTATION=
MADTHPGRVLLVLDLNGLLLDRIRLAKGTPMGVGPRDA